MPFRESQAFVRQEKKYGTDNFGSVEGSEDKLLQFVLTNTPPNDPPAILKAIDSFCRTTWMMNLGEDKAEIIKPIL